MGTLLRSWTFPLASWEGPSTMSRTAGSFTLRLILQFLVLYMCASVCHGLHRNKIRHKNTHGIAFWASNASIELQHAVFNPLNDVLYVGGTNRLYEINTDDMSVASEVGTGPRFDSPKCHASGCIGDLRSRRVLTDNINKVLILVPSTNNLIMCGSVSQGACEKFRTANISLTPEFIPKSVAANDPLSSTYAFIGPEKYNPWDNSDVLYVGTTFTTVGDYRHDVPAISTRSLYDLNYAKNSFSKQSVLRIDVKYRDHFLVQYIYGFNASNYAYFVTVQKKSHLPGQEETGYISRLTRTCISDSNYDSYTEITLQCLSSDGTNNNLIQDAKLITPGPDLAASLGVFPGTPVLIGVFSPSQGHTSKAESSSAMCLYSIRDIESTFNANIHMCFNGSMQYRGMEYISGPINDGKCPQPGKAGNILNFCEVGLKISGTSPLRARAAIELPGVSVTAVQATTTGNHTVAFLGTSRGTLKKIFMVGAEDAVQYAEEPVDAGTPLLPDMPLDTSEEHLFVLTKNRVTKYRVERCASFTNCSGCLEAKDPYCGWCSLEKRCTIQSACQKASFSSPRWLSFGAGQQCIDFEMIRPDRLPIDQTDTVQLTITTLPELPSGAKYQCVWGAAPPSDAKVTGAGLTCVTPLPKHRPQIPSGDDHVLVPLAVRSSETNKDFVSRNFAFYDCGHHETCGSCVASGWACNWCVYDNKCTHNISPCTGTVVSADKNPAHLASHGSAFCPRFWRNSGDLLAADGARTELSLITENLPAPRAGQLGFQCVISIEGATMVVGARSLGIASALDLLTEAGNNTMHKSGSRQPLHKVVCDASVYGYEASDGEYLAKVTLVWNQDHVVDWRYLTLYKCDILGAHRGHQDCSLCVTRPSRFKCTWCGAACRYAPHCPASAQALINSRVADYDLSSTLFSQCPTPRIDVIHPLAGPLEGSTLVTIEGSNLGLKKQDVIGRVFIGDVPCVVEDYHVSVRIVCRTGPAPRRYWGAAPSSLQFAVRVSTPAGTTESTVKFSYTNVSVSKVWPALGPVSGGTTISISGQYLNVGSHVAASFDNLPCVVNKTQSSSHRLVCVTSKAAGAHLVSEGREIRTLIVKVDAAERRLPMPFVYTPDPTILRMKPLSSPWSGGRMLTVHGAHFNSIQSPKIMILYKEHILNSSVCTVVNPSQMECPSPRVDPHRVLSLIEKDSSLRRGRSIDSSSQPDELNLQYGFIMDNVEEVRHLSQYFPSVQSQMTYMRDPKYVAFEQNIKFYKGDTLVIEGEHINYAADESDIKVTIGGLLCNVTSLASNQLVCEPPTKQPPPTDERGVKTPERLPLVVVEVGSHLRFPIGVLRYEKDHSFPLSPETIGGLAAGALFVVLAAFVVLALYRRKSSQAERVYKLMQLQMDSLESHVRTECKQAFAELQTDMTDLTADLQSSGIPILDEKSFIMKVFFPGVCDHPILNDPKVNEKQRTNYNVAMLHFEQLIANKSFLVAFIEALESQKSFSIRDKVNVASLLTVVLMDRLEYLTEILHHLLLRLISATAATKHPQLMLRRTETVVEKMLSNWLALCMYSKLKGEAGTTLFLLYKAIKHQVEKGPVDALTHDARYSLSEEKLLREQVDCHPVTVHLLHEDPHYEKIPYQAVYSVCSRTLTVPEYTQYMSQLGRQTMTIGPEEYEEKVQVKVLDCDTISQVKSKVLDALYKNTPFSLRPSVHQVDLELRHGRAGRVSLNDEDATSVTQPGGWKRLNTLAHYGVRDSAVVALTARQNDSYSSNGTGFYSYTNSVSPLQSPCRDESRLNASSGAGIHKYHLVRPAEDASITVLACREARGERTYGTHKAVPEIFLTRLLSTKGTVQQFVDDFVRTILSPNDSLSPAVKWLFDLLDQEAVNHGIDDADVVHAWKSNCLPLRFWVNFIKNPDFIFDVAKTPTVESCLGVIAQTFVDACSTTEHRLGKDSPSNKLLFAKDIPKYRYQVMSFYEDITKAQPVSQQELAQQMQQLSAHYKNQFDNIAALKELYIYVSRYHQPILDCLEADASCRSLNLGHRLQSISYILESYGHTGPVAPMPPGQLSEL